MSYVRLSMHSESDKRNRECVVIIDPAKCIGCGRCYDVCQGEAIIPVNVTEEEKK